MTTLDLRCTTVSALATQYLEDELNEAQRTSYETHLVLCDNCQSYIGDLRDIAPSLRGIPADAVDEGERSRILDRARG